MRLPRPRRRRPAAPDGATALPPPARAPPHPGRRRQRGRRRGAGASSCTLQGHDARTVHDGPAALAAAAELRPRGRAARPRAAGHERLRGGPRGSAPTLGKRVLLVALTGYQDDKGRLHEAGFDAHLLKPTQLEKLFALLAGLDQRDEVVDVATAIDR